MATLLLATSLHAHDGGFGHSRRTIFISATADGFLVEYRVKQGLEEALVELMQIDADRNGRISAEEKNRHFARRAAGLLARLTFRPEKVDAAGETAAAKAHPVKFVGYELHHSLVQVLRFQVTTSAPTILLEDRNYSHKPGQISVTPGKGVKVELAQAVDLTHAEQVLLKITRTDR